MLWHACVNGKQIRRLFAIQNRKKQIFMQKELLTRVLLIRKFMSNDTFNSSLLVLKPKVRV